MADALGRDARAGLEDRPPAPALHRPRRARLRPHLEPLSICVVVNDDHGARQASHSLRAAGWGGVAFETNVDAARRTAVSGRACVLNVSRLDASIVEPFLAEAFVHDWRVPPPEMSQDEWLVLYGAGEFTDRARANRLKSAQEKVGDDFEQWRLPSPRD